MTQLDDTARAICRERCAYMGEPPCWKIGAWPNEKCSEPGCLAFADAAINAIAAWNRRAPGAEETRLRAEVASLRATLGQQPVTEGAEPIGCPLPGMCSAVKASAAGYAAGAEAMREAAAGAARAFPARTHGALATAPYAAAEQSADEIEAAIRALPIPEEPK